MKYEEKHKYQCYQCEYVGPCYFDDDTMEFFCYKCEKEPNPNYKEKEIERCCDTCQRSILHNSTGENCLIPEGCSYPDIPYYIPIKPKEKEMSSVNAVCGNYFMLDGKQIEMSQETADSLRKSREKKYRAGDYFKGKYHGHIYVLIEMNEPNLQFVDLTAHTVLPKIFKKEVTQSELDLSFAFTPINKPTLI